MDPIFVSIIAFCLLSLSFAFLVWHVDHIAAWCRTTFHAACARVAASRAEHIRAAEEFRKAIATDPAPGLGAADSLKAIGLLVLGVGLLCLLGIGLVLFIMMPSPHIGVADIWLLLCIIALGQCENRCSH